MQGALLALLVSVAAGACGAPVFFDDFEYTVERDTSGAKSVFLQHGWNDVKTYQDGEPGARGYLYTVTSIPGFSGTFPGIASNSVLAIEARPQTYCDPGDNCADPVNGTDLWLQKGGETAEFDEHIPGDVWFQFWLYPNYYGDQLSRYEHAKFLYPTNTYYPSHSLKWLQYFGPKTYNPNMGANPIGDPSEGEFFFVLRDGEGVSVMDYLPVPDYDENKIGQQDISEWIRPNQWTLVKIHFDTSTTSASWEMWYRTQVTDWIKVADWIDGITPNFSWTVPVSEVGGHRALRMPTTIGLDSWTYMDDFAIATSEADLPVYGESTPATIPSDPVDGHMWYW